MVTEHNYRELFYPVVTHSSGERFFVDENRKITANFESADLFPNWEDAGRWALRAGLVKIGFEIETLSLPFCLQYQDGPIWQCQRFYTTDEAARAGFDEYINNCGQLGDRIWRLINFDTGDVLLESQPNKWVAA